MSSSRAGPDLGCYAAHVATNAASGRNQPMREIRPRTHQRRAHLSLIRRLTLPPSQSPTTRFPHFQPETSSHPPLNPTFSAAAGTHRAVFRGGKPLSSPLDSPPKRGGAHPNSNLNRARAATRSRSLPTPGLGSPDHARGPDLLRLCCRKSRRGGERWRMTRR